MSIKVLIKALRCTVEHRERISLDDIDAANLLAEIDRLRAELLAAREQEPVVWVTPDGEGWRMRFEPPLSDVPMGWTPLYGKPMPPSIDAHELWAAAQLTPGEGIEDGVDRIAALLAAAPKPGEG